MFWCTRKEKDLMDNGLGGLRIEGTAAGRTRVLFVCSSSLLCRYKRILRFRRTSTLSRVSTEPLFYILNLSIYLIFYLRTCGRSDTAACCIRPRNTTQ
jgi:hypothetical protein